MADLSTLSDDQLTQLYQQAVSNQAIATNESGNAPVTATPINPSSTAQSSMQVVQATRAQPGFGVTPSNGTPEDTAREGRDLMGALTQHYGNADTAAVAYNWGSGNTDKWIASGSKLSDLPDAQLKYLYNYKQGVASMPDVQPRATTTGAPQGYGSAAIPPAAPAPAPTTPSQRALAAIAALKPSDYTGMTASGLRQLGLTARAVGNGIANGAGALTQGFTRAMGVPDVQPLISNAINSVTPAPQGAVQNAVQAIGSQVANPVNYLPGMAGTGLVRGAVGGALAAGMQPTPAGTTPLQIGQNIAAGGATGGLMGGLGTALQGMNIRPAAADLMRQGVNLTPGQALGGAVNDLEQKATSIPMLGNTITGARSSAVRDFNTAIANQTLAPLGQTVAKGTPTRDLVEQVGNRISAEYDSILPQVTFHVDTQLKRDMTPIFQQVATMPADIQTAFHGIMDRNFGSQLSSGQMSGTAFKDADSVLGREAANFNNSSDAFQRNLGSVLRDTQTVMRNSLERTNPNAPTLGPINAAWRNYTVLRNAGARVNNPEQPIQPGQFQAAVKQGAGNGPAGKGAFAAGNANMQPLSDAGMSVLGNNVPDSGTAGRGLLAGFLAGGGGKLALTHPVAAGGAILGSAAYGTQAGRAAMLAALARRPGPVRALGATAGLLAAPSGATAAQSLDANRTQEQQ